MHKLAAVPSSPLLEELMSRLKEAGIAAVATPQRSVGELYVGGPMTMGVWIDDARDMERAASILRELQGNQSQVRCLRRDEPG